MTRFEIFRALIVSKYESFRALKLSKFENFRALTYLQPVLSNIKFEAEYSLSKSNEDIKSKNSVQ